PTQAGADEPAARRARVAPWLRLPRPLDTTARRRSPGQVPPRPAPACAGRGRDEPVGGESAPECWAAGLRRIRRPSWHRERSAIRRGDRPLRRRIPTATASSRRGRMVGHPFRRTIGGRPPRAPGPPPEARRVLLDATRDPP